MPSHPRIEEVEDSDVDMSDPSEDDIDDFAEEDILRQRVMPSRPKQQPQAPPPTFSSQRTVPQQSQQQQQQFLPPQAQPRGYPEMQTTADDSAYKSYQCLYPVYFDATRTRAEGRRVSRALAVANPLATEIVNACASLRLMTVLEAGKLHPKDWANPGRVKVALKEGKGAGHHQVKNKHHLYVLVAQHLKRHPATDDAPALRVVVRGAPPPPQVEAGKPWPRVAAPRGWKMGELLPYYSPAMTGGGVSENFLKDMMKEMGGAGGPGADMASLLAGMGAGGPGGAGAGGAGGGAIEEKRKKDKKGKK
ncbi:signal recognition particle, SRP19 subunit [Bombardia bombarda]|uniref:Signal recognition particle, SRP19 subunit n=1 Tax=Bombardia bombarda TaxID=252184 RepID=A0AA39XIK3_9PEZI|nr:signal recognition particle, SRP19 subunit [Bombardia bombarda]